MPKSPKQKRIEVEERRMAYEKLTPEDQLARLEARPGDAKAERVRLMARIEARAHPAKRKKVKK